MKRNMLNRVLSLVLVLSMVMSFAVMPVGATEGEGGEPHVHTWVSGTCSDTACNATCNHEGTEKTENVTASTCAAAGTKTVTCVCGVVISTETLALAEHSYDEATGLCNVCSAQKPTEPQGEEQPAQCSKNAECTATENHDAQCPKHPDYVAPVACDKSAECKATENHDAECLKAKADAEAAAAAQAKIDEVNTLINALPEAVTAENYESVMTQLTAIMAYQSTMGDLWAQTNQEKLQAVIAMTQAGVPMATTDGEAADAADLIAEAEAASAGVTIKLIADITLSGQNAADKLTARTIDLNGKTLTLAGNSYFKDGTTIFKNGKIVVSGYASDSFLCGYTSGARIVLDGVNLTGSSYKTGCAVLNANQGTIEVKNSTITLSGDTEGGIFYGGNVVVENTDITATNVCRGFTNSVATIKNGSTVTFTGGETGLNNSTVTIDASTVEISGATKRAVRLNNNTLTLNNDATLTATNCAAGIVPYNENSEPMVNVDSTSTLNAPNTIPEPVAKIGNQGYKTLQKAFEAAQVAGGTITMLADSNEAITFTQNPGQLITLDGNGKTMTGTIVMAARAGTDGNALFTVQNLNFTTDRTAGRFIQSEETNYYPWIKVTGCTFSGPGANTTVVAVGVKSSPKVIIENCVVSNMHSVLQNTSGWNATVSNVRGSNLAEGLNMGTCQNVVIENCDISANMYAVRADLATVNRTIKITGSKLTSADASNATVIFRKGDGNGKSDITITGNTITAPTGGQWMKDISTTAPCVILTTDEQVDTAAYAAKNGNTYYTHIADAVSALTTKGGTVFLLKDVTEHITITAPADKNAVIDLNGKTVSGAVTIEKGAAATIIGKLSGNLNVNGTLSVAENTTLEAAALAIDGEVTVANGGKVISNGAITISANGIVNVPVGSTISGATLAGAGTINIDAAKYTADVDVITADTTGFTGTVSAVNAPVVSGNYVGAFKNNAKIYVKKIALPSAVVTTNPDELDGTKPTDLTFGAKFTISDDTTAEQLEFFKDWEVDFVLTIDQTIPDNKGAAAGYYATFCQNGQWIQYGPFDDEIPAGSYKIMGLVLNGHGLPFSMISGDVKSFSCGLIIDETVNPGLKAKLELRMYDPAMLNDDDSWPEDYAGITIEKRDYEAAYAASIKETGKRFATVEAALAAATTEGGTVVVKNGVELPKNKTLTSDKNIGIEYNGNCIQLLDGGTITIDANGVITYAPKINEGKGYGTVVVTNSTGSTTYFVQAGSTITAYNSGVVSNPTGEYLQEKTHDHKPDYNVTDVDNKGTVTKNDSIFYVNTAADMMFKCDGFYSTFVKAQVFTKADVEIPFQNADYTVKPGCTELTLKNSFLSKLAEGDYTLVMQYKDGGTATANFFVRKIAYTPDYTNPKTGDDIFAPAALMLFSVSALAVLMLNKKRIF